MPKPVQLAWLERGGVLAVAHVRGGGAYGKPWHHAGRKLTKPNTWRDFIACCEYLVREGRLEEADRYRERATARSAERTGTVEGFRHGTLPVFSVQYHPEAAPGPHDARPLFKEFLDEVRKRIRTDEPNA